MNCHGGKRKARAAGSWCAAFQRNGAPAALPGRQVRMPETGLHKANPLNASGTHFGGRMHTWNLRPERPFSPMTVHARSPDFRPS